MALQDKIGRSELVDKICGLVDALKVDGQTCLAINGAWGSGKSFVLGLIEKKLSQNQEYIIIKYDAWENTFYSDPLIAILSCVIDGIEEKMYLVERTKQKLKEAGETGADILAELLPWVKKLKTVTDGIKTIIKDFHIPIDTTGLNDFKSYQKLLKETREYILKVIQDSKQNQEKSICFVTGVPGAGKTLVGLEVANMRDEGAVYLSGNGPLVAVLTEALAQDNLQRCRERNEKKKLTDSRREVSKSIQMIHRYRDNMLAKIKNPVENGILEIDPTKAIENGESGFGEVEHVAIFDEAQRSWTHILSWAVFPPNPSAGGLTM